jgi:general secretion pathway protein M
MIDRLPALHRRIVAIGGVVLLVAIVYVAVIGPVVASYRHYDERIADLTDRLQRYQRAAQDREANARLLEQRKRTDPSKRLYLTGQNASLAAAELQGLIKRAVEQSKGELLSMQVVSPSKAERVSEVTVKVRVKGDIQTLQKSLHALEAGRPVLLLNKLTVDAVPTVTRVAGAGKTDAFRTDGVDLSISVDVTGYLRKQTG